MRPALSHSRLKRRKASSIDSCSLTFTSVTFFHPLCESAPKESDASSGIRSPVGPLLPDIHRDVHSVLCLRGAHQLAPVAGTSRFIHRDSDPLPQWFHYIYESAPKSPSEFGVLSYLYFFKSIHIIPYLFRLEILIFITN